MAHGKTNTFIYLHEPALSNEINKRLAGGENSCLYPLCNTCRELGELELLATMVTSFASIATSLASLSETLKEKLK